MKHGAIAILPLAAGAAVYGFAFGLLAAQVGFPWWGVALMSGIVHAGSSQIVAVEQFAGTSAVLALHWHCCIVVQHAERAFTSDEARGDSYHRR